VAGYAVEFTAGAAKEIRRLDTGARKRIVASIAGLAADPRPVGCKKLVGEQNPGESALLTIAFSMRSMTKSSPSSLCGLPTDARSTRG